MDSIDLMLTRLWEIQSFISLKTSSIYKDVRNVNSVARKWTLSEYLMSYCKLGKKDYQLLEWFHRTYEFGIAECIAMLNGKGYCNTTITKRKFKRGDFVIDNLEQGKTWAKQINACGEYFQYYKKVTFVKSYVKCYER